MSNNEKSDLKGISKVSTTYTKKPSDLFNTSLCTVDPSNYISKFPIIPILTEEWMKLHIKASKDHINQTSLTIKEIINELEQAHQSFQIFVRDFIDKTSDIVLQRLSFKGRGLREFREMLFLIHKLNSLKIHYYSLSLIDTEISLSHYLKLSDILSLENDFSQHFVSVNLRGFSAAIPNNQIKIQNINHKIALMEKHILVPKFIPPPQNLEDQLIYPTSSTVSLFNRFERPDFHITIDSLLTEFRQMTNDKSELEILIDLAFSYAWRSGEYPFLQKKIEFTLPAFSEVRVSLFKAPHIPEKYEKMHINQLFFCDWPYKTVVDYLMTLFFLINPIEMSKVIFEAMGMASSCIRDVTNQLDEIDFDTIFPLIMVCLLAAGIPNEPRILFYIATLTDPYKEDSICQFGASYAEAIITHLLELNEDDLLMETQRLDSSENDSENNNSV